MKEYLSMILLGSADVVSRGNQAGNIPMIFAPHAYLLSCTLLSLDSDCRVGQAPSCACSVFLQALALQIFAPLWEPSYHAFGSCGLLGERGGEGHAWSCCTSRMP